MEYYKVPELPILDNTHNLSKEKIVSILEKMLTIRFTEQRIAQRVQEKKVFTPCHLYNGQEASAVGVCTVLRDTDYVFSTHRSHGHFIAKGGKLDELFGEIYCRETGCSGGRGGSMHLCDPSIGLLGSSSIVGGGLGIGMGPAFMSKIMNRDDVSVIFHGDCVPEEGIWHESLNFAAVKKLPVVYICENNLYAASAGLDERRIYDNIPKLASEYGLPSEIVDGNDVFAVYDAAMEAIERARNGKGPQFIESRTYRWLGHVGPNDDIDKGLRDYDELMYWKRRCPIANLEKWLLNNSIVDTEELNELRKIIQSRIDSAEAEAIEAKQPAANTLYNNVYHGEVVK